MAVDLSYSPEVENLIERTRAFVRDVVLPIEDEHAGDIAAAGGDELRKELQAEAANRDCSRRTRPSSSVAWA